MEFQERHSRVTENRSMVARGERVKAEGTSATKGHKETFKSDGKVSYPAWGGGYRTEYLS